MYKTESLKLTYDILNGHTHEEFMTIFTHNIDMHGHNTRQRNHIYEQSQRKASMSFLHNGPKLWSALPQ
jgi:hypothetical protein